MVGGKVTPDKLYVFQRDDGSEVVIRQMGCKDMKIVYDERGGTREVAVPELEALRWALSLSQAERVAKGVRAVSKAYGGMIMDTEFCIDANDKLWFVQARPETRWNEELELHPTTIFMRRLRSGRQGCRQCRSAGGRQWCLPRCRSRHRCASCVRPWN